jgi:hypothetical protein
MKLADLTQLQDNQKRLMDSVEQMFLAMESAIDLFPWCEPPLLFLLLQY